MVEMGNQHSEKWRLEDAAIDNFLSLYSAKTGRTFRVESRRERPDAIIRDETGTAFGLEVAHLYDTGLEAQMLLGRSSAQFHPVQSDSQLTERLNNLLEQKAQRGRHYSCPHPILLVIRSASPIFTGPDFEKIRDSLQVPGGVFEEIWLLARDDNVPGWPHLIRLR